MKKQPLVMDQPLINLAGAHLLAGEIIRRSFNPNPKTTIHDVWVSTGLAKSLKIEYDFDIPKLDSKPKDYVNIFVSNKKGKTITIQVRATPFKPSKVGSLKGNIGWKMSAKSKKDLVYAFVTLNNQEKPYFYFIPSKDVADYLKKRKDKTFWNVDKKYFNNWGLLEGQGK
jgi:hypothetical protein